VVSGSDPALASKSRRRRIVYTLLVVTILAVSVVLATRAAAPDPLPGVALGSESC